eukprot:1151675-Pelagomonas_calceolata.AAC.2
MAAALPASMWCEHLSTVSLNVLCACAVRRSVAAAMGAREVLEEGAGPKVREHSLCKGTSTL